MRIGLSAEGGEPVAKRRQTVAHGASRGLSSPSFQASRTFGAGRGRKRRQAGLTFIEFLVVVVVLVVLAAILLPQMARTRGRASRIGCTNILKQNTLAFRMWALDHNDKFPMQVSITNGGVMEWIEAGNVWMSFLVMSNELNTPKLLMCPTETNTNRRMATTFSKTPAISKNDVPFSNNTNVTYFIGVDANETNSTAWLIGDDNLTVNGRQVVPGLLQLWTNSPVAWTAQRHVNNGNIGMADGSVQGLSSAKLQEYLIQTGAATNRLAMP